MFSFLLGIYVEVELLDHLVTLYLNFWGTAKLFSTLTAPFYIPTSSVWRFRFLQIFANTSYFPFLKIIAILIGEVAYHCGFDLHFSDD